MNSRRLMSDIGLPPAPDRRSRAISMPHAQPATEQTASPWAALNCSELMYKSGDDREARPMKDRPCPTMRRPSWELMFDDNPRDIMEAAQWRALRPPDHYAGIQFTSQSVSSTKATTTIAPKIMSCPRTNFGRSAALILIITPPEHIEMYMRSSSQTALWRAGGPGFFSGAAGR